MMCLPLDEVFGDSPEGFLAASSGDRMALEMSGEQSGLIAEGDQGQLTFQGTRFISFERDR